MHSISIYKRCDGRFEGRVYIGKNESGKRKNKSFYGRSITEVVEKYTADHNDNDQLLTNMTVRDLFREWFTAASIRIKESTAANYHMKAEKHIIPVLGDTDCGALKSKDIYGFITKIAETNT